MALRYLRRSPKPRFPKRRASTLAEPTDASLANAERNAQESTRVPHDITCACVACETVHHPADAREKDLSCEGLAIEAIRRAQ